MKKCRTAKQEGFRVCGFGCRVQGCRDQGKECRAGLWFTKYGVWFKDYGVWFVDSNQGGGRSPTPHGTNPGIVRGGKASGEGGGRTGRRKPSGISPGAKVSSKERLCSSLYLSTRDLTSLLLEESSQSL